MQLLRDSIDSAMTQNSFLSMSWLFSRALPSALTLSKHIEDTASAGELSRQVTDNR